MWSKKCGKGMGLCPLSFGVALGITSGLAFFLWSVWIMYHGMPPMMAASGMVMTWSEAITYGLWALLKGFIFGFVLALLYDLIICCCRCKCCKNGTCGTDACKCGCRCCVSDKGTTVNKM